MRRRVCRWIRRGWLTCLVAVAITGLGPADTATAQVLLGTGGGGAEASDEAPAVPTPVSAEEIDNFLATLDDTSVRLAMRDFLLAELDAAGGPDQPSLAEQYQARMAQLRAGAETLPSEFSHVEPVLLSASQGLPFLVLLLGFGFGTGWVVRRLLVRSRSRLIPDQPVKFSIRVTRAVGILVFEALEFVGFFVAVAIVFFLAGDGSERATAIGELAIYTGIRIYVVILLARLLLGPDRPLLRLCALPDDAARAAFKAIFFIVVCVVLIAMSSGLVRAVGMSPTHAVLISVIVSAVVIFVLVLAPWVFRGRVAAALTRTMASGSGFSGLVAFWPVPLNLYFLIVWIYSMDLIVRRGVPALDSFLAAVVGLVALIAIAHSITVWLERSLRLEPAEAAAEANPDGTVAVQRIMAPTTTRLAKSVWIGFMFLGFWLLSKIYGIRLADLVGLNEFGGGALSQAVVVVLASYVGYAVLAALIDRHLARLPQTTGDSRAKRMRTLLPLLRSFLLVVIILMVGLIVLASFGVDIGPLIAGAGVIGLAIGLGAQSLVTDIVAGVFFLIDDAFAVGDYIETGGLMGSVESISLRSLKLRHHRGAVHTIPFGQMASLTNYSRDWVIMKLEFRVAPDTDLKLVKKIVKRIGAELLEDEMFGGNFLEPLKSQGVRRFEDSAMIIGLKFMTIPGEQFTIRREVFQRIRDAFKENNIQIVDKGVVVRVGRDEDETAAVAAAAAAQSSDQADQASGPVDDR